MNRSRWTQAFIAVSALTIANSAPALAAGTIGCGAMLTANTTLTTDLVGCVGDGLVVGSDGITVNLNGHVISGDAVEDPSDMGIRVTGHPGVHVTKGIVQGFWRGVVFDGSPVGVVTSMTVRQMSVIDPTIVAQMVGRRRRVDPMAALTAREGEVLGLVAEGMSDRALATRLFVTERTVEAHVTQIFLKLGLPDSSDVHRRVLAVLTFLRS